jgi:energy-coupling factor transporter ATP-binding protein EcfA2
MEPHTDAPNNFITWSALSLIGATLKNNVYLKIGTYTLFPNQFIVLVAPPGIGKGTAMNMVKGIIDETKPNTLVNTLSDRITAERIIERIADGWQAAPMIIGTQLSVGKVDHNVMLFSEELRVLLGASEWMLTFLEVAWSQSTFDYQTKNKGSVSITSMCCSLLAASVPDFLRNVNHEASMVITGGFSSRCLFIYAEAPSKDLPWPQPLEQNPQSKALYDKLVIDLQSIASLKGEYRVDTAARIRLETFLSKNRVNAMRDDSEAVANFRARIKAHVIKLAMVLSASRGDSLTISDFDMLNAIAEVNKITLSLEKLFRGAGDSFDAVTTARIQAFVEKVGQTTRSEIMRALHRHIGSFETLDRILTVLIAIGFCQMTLMGKQQVIKHTPGAVRKP